MLSLLPLLSSYSLGITFLPPLLRTTEFFTMTIFHHRFSIGKKQEQVVAIRVQPPQPQTVKERQVIPKLARQGKVKVMWENC